MIAVSNVAVFFHCRISGGAHPANDAFPGNAAVHHEHAKSVVSEQINALINSGLLGHTDHFIVGVNGTEEDMAIINRMANGQAEIKCFGEDLASELTTLGLVHEFAVNHPGWFVLYHHSKGVMWTGGSEGQYRKAWRRCMEKACVWRWRECVAALESGYDMAGAHWLDPKDYPEKPVGKGIWAGNFFWATSDYLATLPLPHEAIWRNRYWAEMWCSLGEKYPKVRDFAPHYPDTNTCEVMASQQ